MAGAGIVGLMDLFSIYKCGKSALVLENAYSLIKSAEYCFNLGATAR